MNQNSVTGEYTCMVLKALKNDDVKAAESDEWGFYGPLYQGDKLFLSSLIFFSLSSEGTGRRLEEDLLS